VIETDNAGTLHVISFYDVTGPGVWYANNADGAFSSMQLREPTNTVEDGPGSGGSALALDGDGRPHVLYDVYESFPGDRGPIEDGLWYTIGPPAP
jgi:hypothetical protein